MSAILKYSKNVYQQKINTMESLASRLSAHLDRLETYKDELSSFWDDAQAAEYLKKITDQIIKVRNALNNLQNVKQIYQTTVDEMDKNNSVIDDIISDVGSAIGTVSGISDLTSGGSADKLKD